MTEIQMEGVVGKLYGAASGWLDHNLNNFLEHVKDHFAQLARSSSNQVLARQLRQSIELLDKQHPLAEDTLRADMRHRLIHRRDNIEIPAFEKMSLVDDLELDRNIRRAQMVAYLLNNHRSEIKSIEYRLEVLAKQGTKINPTVFSPPGLFEAMKNALDAYRLPELARKEFVDFFGVQTMPRFRELYALLAKVLTEHGIEAGGVRHEPQRQPSGSLTAGSAEAREYTSGEVLDALEMMSEMLPSRETDAEPLIARLVRRLQTDNAGRTVRGPVELADKVEGQLHYVEKMMDRLCRDEHIDRRVRDLVSLLSVPMALMAVRDADVFHDPEYPGRMLIRELTMFGLAKREVVNARIAEVAVLVAQVRAEAAADREAVARAAESIWKICEQEIEHPSDASRHVSRQEMRDRRLGEAKRRVMLELREQLLDKQLPDELRPCVMRLLGPWMVVRYLRYGHNSRPWLEALAYMKLSFEAMQPAGDQAQFSRRISLRNHLMRVLAQKAARSTLPPEEVREMVGRMENYLERINQQDYANFQAGQPGEMQSSMPGSDVDAGLDADEIADVPAMHENDSRD